jgi:hypothetical protein
LMLIAFLLYVDWLLIAFLLYVDCLLIVFCGFLRCFCCFYDFWSSDPSRLIGCWLLFDNLLITKTNNINKHTKNSEQVIGITIQNQTNQQKQPKHEKRRINSNQKIHF